QPGGDWGHRGLRGGLGWSSSEYSLKCYPGRRMSVKHPVKKNIGGTLDSLCQRRIPGFVWLILRFRVKASTLKRLQFFRRLRDWEAPPGGIMEENGSPNPENRDSQDARHCAPSSAQRDPRGYRADAACPQRLRRCVDRHRLAGGGAAPDRVVPFY